MILAAVHGWAGFGLFLGALVVAYLAGFLHGRAR